MFLKALTSESFWWWLEIMWKVCSRQLQWLHCNPQQWNLVWDMFLPGMDSSFFTEWKVTNVARGVNQQLKFWQHYNEKRIFSHCPGYSKSPHSSDRTLVLISQVNTQKRVSQQQQTKTSLARWPYHSSQFTPSASLKYMALKNFSSWHFKCTVSGVPSQVKAFQCSVLPNAPGLGSTHRISAPQRICCKCAPASQQRWAIPQTLADLTEENSYWQCLKKETTLCELCHSPALAKPYWARLSGNRSKGKSQYRGKNK